MKFRINWSEEKAPTKEIPYTHITGETPLGLMIIDWKGWKEAPSYEVTLKVEEWIPQQISVEYDLDAAKLVAQTYLHIVYNSLDKFLYPEKYKA